MKKYAIILPAIGLTMGTLRAQTVPLFINYQGKVTGGTGIPLGATGTAPNFTAAPINRKVIFRIYDAPTAGNRLWSEQQSVTISLGEFSVLLGQGTASVYDSITEVRPALDSIFKTPGAVTPAGPGRYLEVVVDDGSGTFTSAADVPITPRQRINSTAYSFRAAMADTVADASIGAASLAAGSVTAAKIVDSAITTEKLANLGILTEDIANNAINAAKIADSSIINAKIANGAVSAGKLDPAIGVWTVTGANVYRPAGSIGIGKVPAVAVDVVGAVAATGNITAGGAITATGAITGSSITTTGPFSATLITANAGINIPGTNVLEFGAGVAGKEPNSGKIGYQTFSGNSLDIVGAGAASASRRIKMWAEGGTEFNGRVGIGTGAPAVPLDVMIQNNLTMTDNGYHSTQGFESGSGVGQTYNFTGTYNFGNPLTIEIYGMAGGTHLGGNRHAVAPVGIRSDGWIASGKGIIIYSDRRIKRDARASETARDLAAIQQLKVTDYRMVDPAGDGMMWRKGFIAQEVEQVIPGAITRSVEFVPDIFSVATKLQWNPGVKTLLVTLGKDHDLKVGDRVRLHADGSRLELDVSAVPGVRQFVVDKCERAPEKVLVYGRQVNDFRTVDYDRIYTTSVGALQELKKEKDVEVRSLQEENAALRTRLAALEADGKSRDAKLAALEANDKTRDAKLAEIQTLLLSSGNAGVRTVSVKAGE
jgi:hypothetical protein